MGFRFKTSLLLVVTVLLATAPIVLFSLDELARSAIERERQGFRAAAVILAGEIRAFYHAYQTERSEGSEGRLAALRAAGILAAGFLDGSGGTGRAGAPGGGRDPGAAGAAAGPLPAVLAGRLAELGMVAGVLSLDRGPRARPPASGGGHGLPPSLESLRDARGRPVAEFVREEPVPPGGIFRLLREGGGDGPGTVLAFLRPSGDGRSVYVFASPSPGASAPPAGDPDASGVPGTPAGPSAAPGEGAGRAAEAVLAQLSYRLAELPVRADTWVAVYGGDGKALLTSGAPLEAGEAPGLPEGLRARALTGGFTEETASLPGIDGQFIVLAERYEPLDWYIVLATPVSAISAPARELVWKLSATVAAVLALGILFALVSAGILSRGLLSLERRAREAEGLDLSDPASEGFFRRDALAARGDEVGRVAGAFDRFGLSLVSNIRAVVEAGRAREVVQAELAAARKLQAEMLPLPREAPKSPGFDAAAILEPAQEVGGDLYDFFTAPCGRRCLVIGDVSGKGVPAAIFMAMVVSHVRGAVRSGLQPEEAMSLVNEQLNECNPGSMFVTLVIGLFDARTGVLTFANAGHNPPAVAEAGGGGVRFLESDEPDPLAGAWPGIRYGRREATLEDGELCLFYTDGLTEAQDASGALFGQARLGEALAACPRDPEAACGALFLAVRRWRGEAPQSDDITMLAFRRKIPS
ncbi:MAG: SpoIIE family protein phosphatase [Deltaproteobacteria bacterium]|nr:SpoIIE family protein phosphatase [Deltaproteobacteria bacterium]